MFQREINKTVNEKKSDIIKGARAHRETATPCLQDNTLLEANLKNKHHAPTPIRQTTLVGSQYRVCRNKMSRITIISPYHPISTEVLPFALLRKAQC